jgi:hypothetical protein
MRTTIITRQRDAWGHTLAVYLQDDIYRVGTLSSDGHPIPLALAEFWTYESALARLEHAIRTRRPPHGRMERGDDDAQAPARARRP